MVNILSDIKTYGEELQNSQASKSNIDWILENREDLAANFPSRWVAIENETFQFAHPDLYEVIKTMRGRQGLTSSLVFYFCNMFELPIIVKFCNVELSNLIS